MEATIYAYQWDTPKNVQQSSTIHGAYKKPHFVPDIQWGGTFITLGQST